MTTRTGLMTSNVVECGGFADVSGAGQPDVQFHVLPFMVGWADRAPIEKHGIAIGPCFLRPRSRGSVQSAVGQPARIGAVRCGVASRQRRSGGAGARRLEKHRDP